MMFRKYSDIYIILIALLLVLISYFFYFRIDLTEDKRYSVSDLTKELLQSTNKEMKVTVFLDGDLNQGFRTLKSATADMLAEMSLYASQGIQVDFVNPSEADTQDEREKKYAALAAEGLIPTAIYEKDKEGKAMQKIVFPWMKIEYGNKSVLVNLLKNVRGLSGAENLNVSVENLEFEITDGMRRAMTTTVSKIAFIEGHGELTEAETYDISKSLSRYFQIDRGVIASDASILSPYKAIIVARPTQAFSETDKLIIDQYIMNGGSVLWLMDAVRVSKENLSKSGISPAMELDVNLSDQLFKYGVRLMPVLLQDVQCVQVPVNIAPAGQEPQFEPSPWYFAPLLLSSYQHPITKNITEVRSEFASALETVGENKDVKSTLLLASSDNTHLLATPTTIDVGEVPAPSDKHYFDKAYVPVAILLEGRFRSNFENRVLPEGICELSQVKTQGDFARQIVIADGDIIRNETNGIASDSTTLPLGFDRYMNQQFGNADFIRNAVLYLANDSRWLELRARTVKLRLLNKRILADERHLLQIINVLLPLLILALGGVIYIFIRRYKNTR